MTEKTVLKNKTKQPQQEQAIKHVLVSSGWPDLFSPVFLSSSLDDMIYLIFRDNFECIPVKINLFGHSEFNLPVVPCSAEQAVVYLNSSLSLEWGEWAICFTDDFFYYVSLPISRRGGLFLPSQRSKHDAIIPRQTEANYPENPESLLSSSPSLSSSLRSPFCGSINNSSLKSSQEYPPLFIKALWLSGRRELAPARCS